MRTLITCSLAFNISEHFIFLSYKHIPCMITPVFLFRTTYDWYERGYLLGDGHRGDALIDGTAGWQEGAHVLSDCRRLDEAEVTETLHLHLYLSTTDQLTYSNKNQLFLKTPLNAPQIIKLHIMYACYITRLTGLNFCCGGG